VNLPVLSIYTINTGTTQTVSERQCLWPACDFFNLVRRMQHNGPVKRKLLANSLRCRHKELKWDVNMGPQHPQPWANSCSMDMNNIALFDSGVATVITYLRFKYSILMLKGRYLISVYIVIITLFGSQNNLCRTQQIHKDALCIAGRSTFQ